MNTCILIYILTIKYTNDTVTKNWSLLIGHNSFTVWTTRHEVRRIAFLTMYEYILHHINAINHIYVYLWHVHINCLKIIIMKMTVMIRSFNFTVVDTHASECNEWWSMLSQVLKDIVFEDGYYTNMIYDKKIIMWKPTLTVWTIVFGRNLSHSKVWKEAMSCIMLLTPWCIWLLL